jgi:carbon storage regulator CsrA
MLVLSRRPEQHFSFPELGVHVRVLNVRGNVVKIGIEAPRDLSVVRGELAPDLPAKPTAPDAQTRKLTRQQWHDLKNRFNALSLATRLLQKQREAGMDSAAEATLSRLVSLVEELRRTWSIAAPPAQGDAPVPRRRTLLVEDDGNERELLAAILRMNGYEVETACDGVEALHRLQSGSDFDLVLLDMCMPRLDGRGTLRSIRGNPSLSSLKVFAVSGSEPSAFGIETGPRGVDRWFSKPLDPAQLVSAMRQTSTSQVSA